MTSYQEKVKVRLKVEEPTQNIDRLDSLIKS